MKRLGFLYPFLVVSVHKLIVNVFLYCDLQHNTDYVASKDCFDVRININVLDIIKSSTDNCYYEIGGILGSSNGEIIDNIVVDKPDTRPMRRCSYEPNVEYLNQNIELWQENAISFKGIFHTHFGSTKTLSSGDVKYITTIMEVMPTQIEYLYFPIFVLPDRKLICYKASMTGGSVHIQEDILTIE